MSSLPREAVVLCGGQGTRLRSHDASRPKALVPVAGRPFLSWQLEWLRGLGVDKVILATGFRSDQIDHWLRHHYHSHHDSPTPRVELVTEKEALGTAGAVRHLLDGVQGASFFVTNGDTLLPALRSDGVLAASAEQTVMVAVATDGSHTGDCLELAEDRVLSLERRATSGSAWINGGFYRFSRRQVTTWPAETRSLERDVFPRLAASGELLAHRIEPPLLDMGTPEGWQKMSDHLSNPG